ncbi:MAG: glycosyl transferase [Caldiserica bacterium]|nr:MAG: glycosyl transferase [Caldisericota bacterium]
MKLAEQVKHFMPSEYSIYKPRICFVATYIPKECGIATFTNDLLTHIDKHNPLIPSSVIALNGKNETYNYPKEVKKIIRMEIKDDYKKAAEFVNNSDIEVISVQHEFGIFGGDMGEYILDFLENLKKPVVITFHTVLPNPSFKVREIVRKIAYNCDSIVVMTKIGRDILKEYYGITPRKVEIIHHGVPFVYLRPTEFAKKRLGLEKNIVLSTFGLLSRGKGLEYVIYALPSIVRDYPEVVYLIIGQTHPNVKKQEGESYREFLKNEAERLGVAENVKFVNKFLSLEELLEYLEATDIYITPYLNPNQITSGTLSYAVGCGKVVISTPYLYAKDIIEEKRRGMLVKFRDPIEIADAVIYLLDNPEVKKQMEREAYSLGQKMTWEQVSWEYLKLLSQVSQGRKEKASTFFEDRLLPIKLSHLVTLTDDVGIIQHATFSMANRKTGYTTDDNARALVVAVKHYNLSQDETSLRLINTYLSFIYYMQKSNGKFHNFLGYERNFLDNEGGDDCFGRVIWAMGLLLSSDFIHENIKGAASHIFLTSLPQIENIFSLRGIALCLQGLNYYSKVEPSEKTISLIEKLADRLVEAYKVTAGNDWKWFENIITYANAKLPLGLLLAYDITKKNEYLEIGLESLEFIKNITIIDNRFIPIGNKKWYIRGGKRPYYDQQPIEASCMIEALKAGMKVTGEKEYGENALIVFDWYLGRNTKGEMMYDPVTGGCFDGLTPKGANRNQGAESTISYLLSRLEIEVLL